MSSYVAVHKRNSFAISTVDFVSRPQHPENLSWEAARRNVKSLIEDEIGDLQRRIANLYMALEVLPDRPDSDGGTVWEYKFA